MNRFAPLLLVLPLCGCPGAQQTVQSTTATINIDIAKATTDLQLADDLWAVAKGLLTVAGMAVPPQPDQWLAQAHTVLASGAVDAPLIESLVTDVLAQATTVSATVNVTGAAPAAAPNTAGMMPTTR